MSEAQHVAAGESSSQQSLESLGYRQELKRVVNSLGHVALILSDITPTASFWARFDWQAPSYLK